MPEGLRNNVNVETVEDNGIFNVSSFSGVENISGITQEVIESHHQDILDIIYDQYNSLQETEFNIKDTSTLFTLDKTEGFRDMLMLNSFISQEKSNYLTENLSDLEDINKNTFYHLLSLLIAYIPNDGNLEEKDNYSIGELYDILLVEGDFTPFKRLLLSKQKEIKLVLPYEDFNSVIGILNEIKEIITLSGVIMKFIVKNMHIEENVADFSMFLVRIMDDIFKILKQNIESISQDKRGEGIKKILKEIHLECSFIEASYLHIVDYSKLNTAEEMRSKYNEQLEYLEILRKNIKNHVDGGGNKRFGKLLKDLNVSECKMHLIFCDTIEEKSNLIKNTDKQESFLLTPVESHNRKESEDYLITSYNLVIKNRENYSHLSSSDEVMKDLSMRIASGEGKLTELMNIVFYLYAYCESSEYVIGEELPVVIHDRKFDNDLEFDMNLEASRFIRMGGRKTVNSKIIQNQQSNIISELKDIKKQLEVLATTDKLTGLKNRGEIDNLLQIKYNNVKRLGATSWYIIFDLDGFKAVNDNLGHITGDRILKKLAKILKTHIKRPEDVIGRFGGDEFVLMLDGKKEDIEKLLIDLGRNIQNTLNNLPDIAGYNSQQNKESGKINISASMGIIKIENRYSPDGIMSLSDEALYQVKKNGKNGYLFLGESIQKFNQHNKENNYN